MEAYILRVCFGVELHVMKECDDRVPHPEFAAICSGCNLTKFGECVLGSVRNSAASLLSWEHRTFDIDLQQMVSQWAPLCVSKDVNDRFEAVQKRMAFFREYFCSGLGIMKIAELGGKSQGSKGAIKKQLIAACFRFQVVVLFLRCFDAM